jgi:hypothetical protein
MLNLVRLWILLSAVLVGGGWILSALHELNGVGYVLWLSPFAGFVAFRCWRDGWLSHANFQRGGRKFSNRFRRRAPQLFLVIAAFSLLGGCLYPPVNYDANAYRLPRLLHWLWAGQWHWIHVSDPRLNIAGCGMEWLSAPLVLFSRSDRLLFLINVCSYLLLPGLVFSVFTRLQVPARAAWWWTWLLSAGLCFALQAGSVANDSLAAVYCLAAVDLALRARQKPAVSDLWLSALAAALATGVKQTNLPLLALWGIAAWPARLLLRQYPWRTAAVAGLGLLVSILPITLLNYRHSGAWLPMEKNIGMLWGLLGNAIAIPVQNLLPPFFSLLPPLHGYWPVLWNGWMHAFLKTPWGAPFRSYDDFGFLSAANYHGVCEADAGLGLGLCLVILATVSGIARLKKNGALVRRNLEPKPMLWLLRWAPWGLALVFVAKVGSYENARLFAPYYLFLFPAWLVRAGHSRVARDPGWQRFGLWTMLAAALLVAAANERPLFPARPVFKLIQANAPGSDFLADESVHYLESVYQIMLARREYFQTALPPGETVVGYYDKAAAADEPGLWLPFGHRRVECVLPDDPPQRLRDLGIHYVVLNNSALAKAGDSLQNWLERYHASVTDQYTFPRSGQPATARPEISVVRLN